MTTITIKTYSPERQKLMMKAILTLMGLLGVALASTMHVSISETYLPIALIKLIPHNRVERGQLRLSNFT